MTVLRRSFSDGKTDANPVIEVIGQALRIPEATLSLIDRSPERLIYK